MIINPVVVTVYSGMISVTLTDDQRPLLMEYLDYHRFRYHAGDPECILIYGKPDRLYKLLVAMTSLYHPLVVM